MNFCAYMVEKKHVSVLGSSKCAISGLGELGANLHICVGFVSSGRLSKNCSPVAGYELNHIPVAFASRESVVGPRVEKRFNMVPISNAHSISSNVTFFHQQRANPSKSYP